jgi:hypothetical protein
MQRYSIATVFRKKGLSGRGFGSNIHGSGNVGFGA